MERHLPGTAIGRLRGFTLVELMVTLVILAIALAIATPGMATFLNSSRLRATQGELVSALTLARSEATKRGSIVAVGAIAPTTGAEFSGGWRVYVDANANGQYDDGETVIRSYPALVGDQRFGTVDGTTTAAFNPRGFLQLATEIQFKLCGRTGQTRGSLVRLEPIGLADVVERDGLCS